MDTIIHINSLGHSFNSREKEILLDINLKVERGDIIVLLGDNGIGKTTLLKCISGFIKASRGEVLYESRSIHKWDRKELAKHLAYVSTQMNYSPLLKVWEFIAFGRYPFINWLGVLTDEDLEIINLVMSDCNINHLSQKDMTAISDGERQKVAIARALVQQTSVLLLDEPTTHLDIKNSRAIFKLIKQQSNENQKTILFSSHQIEQAIEIANKVWVFNQKEITEASSDEFRKSKELQSILYGE